MSGGLTPAALREIREAAERYAVSERVNTLALCDALESAWGEVTRLRAALEEIATGKGPFSRDQQTFANNVIENLTGIARRALGGEPT